MLRKNYIKTESATITGMLTDSGGIGPSILVMQTAENRLRNDPSSRWILFRPRSSLAIPTQLDREYLVLKIDEGGRYCNGSPILEACASDQSHSAVSHNPNTLDGSFRSIVRKKHSPLGHVQVISTLRYTSWRLTTSQSN